MCQFFKHLTSFIVAILVKFYCITGLFVPHLEAKSAVPELATSDSEHYWLLMALIKVMYLNSRTQLTGNYGEKWIHFIFEALKPQNFVKYNIFFYKFVMVKQLLHK